MELTPQEEKMFNDFRDGKVKPKEFEKWMEEFAKTHPVNLSNMSDLKKTVARINEIKETVKIGCADIGSYMLMIGADQDLVMEIVDKGLDFYKAIGLFGAAAERALELGCMSTSFFTDSQDEE
jgi:hypothetical protein